MVGDAVLDRGREIPVGDQQARFLVIPAERGELLRLKLERSPWLRAEIERQNWHVLKWQHLDTLARRAGADGVARAGPRPRPAHRAGRRAADDVRGVKGPRIALLAQRAGRRLRPGVPWFPPAALPTHVPGRALAGRDGPSCGARPP